MSTVSISTDSRVSLGDISWETYVALRNEPSNLHVRMTFDQGRLDLMSTSSTHEQLAYLLGRLIDAWTEERDVDVRSCRCTTFQREDLQKGLEPDNCYYIAHESEIRGRKIDLTIDPPPDLAIEVDVTSSSVGRLPVYAALGVPDVWRWSKSELQVLELRPDGQYQRIATSGSLPGFPLQSAHQLICEYDQQSDTSLVKSFRRLIRSLPAGN